MLMLLREIVFRIGNFMQVSIYSEQSNWSRKSGKSFNNVGSSRSSWYATSSTVGRRD
ncbi:MAG: hypothetical protein ACTS6G_06345 [Candidatus Hodgkinia cicadicola]